MASKIHLSPTGGLGCRLLLGGHSAVHLGDIINCIQNFICGSISDMIHRIYGLKFSFTATCEWSRKM